MYPQFNIGLISYIISFVDSFIAGKLEPTNDQLPTFSSLAGFVGEPQRKEDTLSGSDEVKTKTSQKVISYLKLKADFPFWRL